jgi:DNA-binding SARP family transcriptional activator
VPPAHSLHDAGVSLTIHLLGAPSVSVDGTPQRPRRGKKAWALLAYLVLSGRAASREELAGLLFDGADDPLGALRWNLAELRRLLGLPHQLQGQLPAIILPPDAFLDVRALSVGTWSAAIELPGLGRELLEGVHVSGSPVFESWLLAERRHVQAQTEDILHEAALARLAEGAGDGAIDLAARLVAINPLDENFQELLIRSYAASGDRVSAARQLAACVELLRRELGVEPGPGVFAAADATGTSATVTAVTGRAAAEAQLDAGEAAIGAGVLDAGLECLRRAAAEAHACGDLELKARALLALGGALAHAARGRDEEGAAALHESIAIAERIGRGDLAAGAHRELAWIDLLRLRFARALAQIEAAVSAGGRAPIDTGLEGDAAFQQGHYEEGLRLLDAAREAAEAEDDARLTTLALGDIGLIHLMRGDLEPARGALGRAFAIARSLAWNAYLPYPEALLGFVDVSEGRPEAARERLEHAFALGCQVRDCCWEGVSAAGLALVHDAEGDVGAALEGFEDALRRSVREPDASLFGYAFALDLACAFGIRHGIDRSRTWASDLEALASRTMMREFLARAYLHRSALGDPDALAAAQLIASDVDNPALHRMVAVLASGSRAS